MSRRETGTVKWFNNSKGYGLIERQDGRDVFVRFRWVRGEGYSKLSDGQEVEYCVIESPKSLLAGNGQQLSLLH